MKEKKEKQAVTLRFEKKLLDCMRVYATEEHRTLTNWLETQMIMLVEHLEDLENKIGK